jgi:peptide/nickel transport system ATP-binding protein
MTPLLEIENLKRHYPVGSSGFGWMHRKTLRAVDGVSLKIYPGQTLGLVGESGCGKSTTAKLALGLISTTEGSIRLNGKPVSSRRNQAWRAMRADMQLVYQNPASALDRRLTILEQVLEPLRILQTTDRVNHLHQAHEMMRAVGLDASLFNRFPHELSGGQQQRAVIARALVIRPKLLVCDEPISALDVSIQAQVINLLVDLQKQMNLTMLFISHDLKVVKHICSDVAVLYLGKIVEQGTVQEVFDNPSHPYTQALISATSSIFNVGAAKNRIILDGEPPNPIDVPGGCSFHPRCNQATERCRQASPDLEVLNRTHKVACHLMSASSSHAAHT